MTDYFYHFVDKDSALNSTLEERVALLELQVSDLEENAVDLDEDIDFLFDEQVIQDERLLGLEQGINVIESDLDVIDEELESECIFIESCFNLQVFGN